MSIDWVTVLAQLANFLVLVWLLHRFLYRPILDGIDAREASIARRMARADTAKKEAEHARQLYEQQTATSISQQEAAIQQALEGTQHERDALIAQAHRQMAQEHREWQGHLDIERREFVGRLHQSAGETVLALVRKVLRDLADEPLETAILRKAGGRLRPMASELQAAVGAGRQALILTRHRLDARLEQQLRNELDAILPGLTLAFEVNAELSPGLSIRAGGVQVDWTIDSYLEELEVLLAQQSGADVSLDVRA